MPTLIVENGTGLPNSNSYCDSAYVSGYLTGSDLTAWLDAGRASITVEFTSNATNAQSIVVGATTYTLTSGSLDAANKVRLGASLAETLNNLQAALEAVAGVGIRFASGTTANAGFRLRPDGIRGVFTAVQGGSASNGLQIDAVGWVGLYTAVNGTDAAQETALIRGASEMERRWASRWDGERAVRGQRLSWPRRWTTDLDGYDIPTMVVPDPVKQANAELALVALRYDLSAPITPDTSATIVSSSVSVGPISVSESLAGGGKSSTYVDVPKATQILEASGLITSASRSERG